MHCINIPTQASVCVVYTLRPHRAYIYIISTIFFVIQLRPNIFSLTPIEVATAIAAAKQASANVLIAQQQVQAAKENVLAQQRVASEKESQAEVLRQKTDSIAAIQRSEAAAAAQGVCTMYIAQSIHSHSYHFNFNSLSTMNDSGD